MLIKPLDAYKEYDVFLGDGWENWVRVRYGRGEVKVLKTSVEDLDPAALKIIFYKIRKTRAQVL